MPLSEEELRLLEQMERALVEEDPKLASTLRGTGFRRQARRRALLASCAFVVGVAILMAGAIFSLTIVGIVGFVIMLVAAYLGLLAWRGQRQTATLETPPGSADPSLALIQGGKKSKPGKSRTPKPQGTMMERFEERWRRRREERDY
ncbi:MAG: DUF3040 domain-containing protein [Nocardioidaceae bacterium]